MSILYMSLFAIIGVLVRQGVDRILNFQESSFPWRTFSMNILGCAFAALLFVFLKQKFHSDLQTFWLASFCIGFTLFSQYGLQALKAMQENHLAARPRNFAPIIYFLTSPTLGVMAAFITLFAFSI